MLGHKLDEGTNDRRSPRDQQGPGRRPRVARGSEQTRDMAVEAGTRRGAQRGAVKADGWRVGAKSRWTTYHAGRGCGERVI